MPVVRRNHNNQLQGALGIEGVVGVICAVLLEDGIEALTGLDEKGGGGRLFYPPRVVLL